jgi:hypothetical protein
MSRGLKFLGVPGMDKTKSTIYNKLPTRINILGRIFRIVPLKKNEQVDADGIMSLGEQKIGIRAERAIGYLQDTLLHETIHAIDETLLLKMTERQVSNLASVLIAVLKDNPEFTKWILKNE